jgi:hypothetical protein
MTIPQKQTKMVEAMMAKTVNTMMLVRLISWLEGLRCLQASKAEREGESERDSPGQHWPIH